MIRTHYRNGRVERARRWTASRSHTTALAPWTILLVLGISVLAGPSEAATPWKEHVTPKEIPDITPRHRLNEIIMVFGDSATGDPTRDAVSLSPTRLEDAVADSIAAENAILEAGGTIRFRYRDTVIGFSAILPPAGPGARFLSLKFKTAKPVVSANWIVVPVLDPVVHFKYLSFALPVAPPLPKGRDRIGQRLLDLNGRSIQTTVTGRVHVYVIDKGIFTRHAQFGNHVLEGYDPFGGDPSRDCLRHGSRVAGIIGGETFGVAPGAIIHSVRVIECSGKIDLAQAMYGVEWVTKHYRVAGGSFSAVANVSFGFDIRNRDQEWLDSLDLFERAVHSSVTAGITYVVAAGNDGIDAKDISPARLDDVITVGSTDPVDDKKWPRSNIGSKIDIFAPGVDIVSVDTRNEGDWSRDSGTSFAAPHVAGVAALILGRNPGLWPEKVRTRILEAANHKDSKDRYAANLWCGINQLGLGSPNILLHWGAASDDGKKDGERQSRAFRENVRRRPFQSAFFDPRGSP